MEEQFSKLVDLLRCTERASARLHGIRRQDDMLRIVREEFARSGGYDASVLLASDDGNGLYLAETSFPSKRIGLAERATGLDFRTFSMRMNKGDVLEKVYREGTTISATGGQLARQILPEKQAEVSCQLLGIEKTVFVLAPLMRGECTVGVLSVSVPSHVDYCIPSVNNLAEHMSTAFELAAEYEEKKNAENSLSKNIAIFENIPSGLYVYELEDLTDDSSLRLIAANPASEMLTGVFAGEVIGRRIGDCFPGLIEKGVAKRYADVVRTQKAITFDDFEYQDNRVIRSWFNIRAFPLPHTSVGVAFDNVTKLKQALQKEEWTARFSTENPTPVLRIGQTGSLMYANPASEKLLTSWGCRVGEPVPAYWCQMCDDVLNSGKQKTAEAEFGDRILSFEVLPVVEEGYVNLYGRDITERRLAENALRESEAQYRNLFKASPDGILIADLETMKILYSNPVANTLLGYSSEELERLSIPDLHSDRDPQMVAEDVKGHEGTVLSDVSFIRRDGSTILLDISASRTKIAGRTCYLGFLRDATPRRKAEKDQRILAEKHHQSQKMEAVGQLAGGVAHDLNNMLGAILGYTDMMKIDNENEAGEQTNATLGKRLNAVLSATGRAASLVKQLLAFSQQGKYKNDPVDVHGAIGEVVGLLSRSIDKKIEIATDLKANAAIVVGDSGQLQTALLDIAVNARDAMPDGGTIWIGTAIHKLEASEVESHDVKTSPGKFIAITVRDTGSGMAPDVAARIFEPFFTTKDTTTGTGLGLPSAYGTIKNHGGWIDVDSVEGKGSAFVVYLPLAHGRDAESESPASDGQAEVGSARLMIVDDESIVGRVAQEMLSSVGYKVSLFENCSEAMAFFKDNTKNVDLVILDMIMPGHSGHECYLEMKKFCPEVKAILATGFAVETEARKALEEGMIGVIHKPFNRRDLARIVRDSLAGQTGN